MKRRITQTTRKTTQKIILMIRAIEKFYLRIKIILLKI